MAAPPVDEWGDHHFSPSQITQTQTPLLAEPPKKATKHRKRHVPVGPAGLWFSTGRPPNDDPDDTDDSHHPLHNSDNDTTKQQQILSSSFYSPAWTAAQIQLRVTTPNLPGYWTSTQKYAVLRHHLSPPFLLIPDVLKGRGDWKLSSPQRLLVQIETIQSNTSSANDHLWTVRLVDETSTQMTGWIQPQLVQSEQQQCRYIQVGNVWELSRCSVLLDQNNGSRLLLIGTSNIVNCWSPSATEQISNPEYIQWMEERNTLSARILLEHESRANLLLDDRNEEEDDEQQPQQEGAEEEPEEEDNPSRTVAVSSSGTDNFTPLSSSIMGMPAPSPITTTTSPGPLPPTPPTNPSLPATTGTLTTAPTSSNAYSKSPRVSQPAFTLMPERPPERTSEPNEPAAATRRHAAFPPTNPYSKKASSRTNPSSASPQPVPRRETTPPKKVSDLDRSRATPQTAQRPPRPRSSTDRISRTQTPPTTSTDLRLNTSRRSPNHVDPQKDPSPDKNQSPKTTPKRNRKRSQPKSGSSKKTKRRTKTPVKPSSNALYSVSGSCELLAMLDDDSDNEPDRPTTPDAIFAQEEAPTNNAPAAEDADQLPMSTAPSALFQASAFAGMDEDDLFDDDDDD